VCAQVQPTANAGCLGVGNNTISEQRTITAGLYNYMTLNDISNTSTEHTCQD